MAEEANNAHLDQIANTLKDSIEQMISKKEIELTKDTELTTRDVIEYESRMRINGMDKFNAPCYVGAFSFYLSEEEKKAGNAIGALAVYVEQEESNRFLRKLGYKVRLEEDDDVIFEQSGKLAEDIAKSAFEKLTGLGYHNLVMSELKLNENSLPDGIEFDYSQYQYCELAFNIWKTKILVVDVTFGKV